ncbi:metallophosphoesterase [Methylorubrum extorquens]|uniref:Metallophosphoesterase n=1 Tax=Methylorubrum extorquens (strain CM4 / NCIMB 13688) TaxID=440085 RepID=B7L3I1_METC4|nr:metallophosphoesterase [Methylorubrum extorquens]ACK86389.1 metallophosphoesterase [Methylorubrum extorquens CM4]
MPRTFFTADTHFGHAGILGPRMANPRPFASIREHDETLVALWNAVVRPSDEVWHLGDFAYGCSEKHAATIFASLNGRKRLVRGNHDALAESLPWANPVLDVARIYVHDLVGGTFQGIWLSHYAHRTWPHAHRGFIHLYGHSHGTLPGTAASTDVGVDCWEFRPVDLEGIRVRLAKTADVQS